MQRLVIYPAVDSARLAAIVAAAGCDVVNATDESAARDAIDVAEAFFGKMTPAILGRAERLAWVQAPTASLEHYLFPELVEHGCQLSNMRGLYSDVVADHAWALLLCLARNLHIYIRQQLDCQWQPVGEADYLPTFATGPGTVSPVDLAHDQLAGSTLGIVGLGGIGREVAARGLTAGMRIVAVDPRPEQSVPGVEIVWPIELLAELLATSDYVVLAAPHTPRTNRLIDASRLGQMRRTARLINIGRGALVVLNDLTAALASGVIAGAALDVCDPEPLPKEHPLWKMPSAVITPHVAGCSPQIAQRHLQLLVDNVSRFAAGRPLRNLVDKREWY